MPYRGIKYLTQLFNIILHIAYFPSQWKVAQIVLISNPGKPPNEVKSYRPISLLPIISKLFEKTLQTRLITTLENKETIPTHQFGFRPLHSTIEQIHRVVDKITETFQNKQYCFAAFLDITQALWGYYTIQLVRTNLECRRGPKLDECMTYHK